MASLVLVPRKNSTTRAFLCEALWLYGTVQVYCIKNVEEYSRCWLDKYMVFLLFISLLLVHVWWIFFEMESVWRKKSYSPAPWVLHPRIRSRENKEYSYFIINSRCTSTKQKIIEVVLISLSDVVEKLKYKYGKAVTPKGYVGKCCCGWQAVAYSGGIVLSIRPTTKLRG